MGECVSMGVGGVVDVDIALGGTELNDDMECGVSGVAGPTEVVRGNLTELDIRTEEPTSHAGPDGTQTRATEVESED